MIFPPDRYDDTEDTVMGTEGARYQEMSVNKSEAGPKNRRVFAGDWMMTN